MKVQISVKMKLPFILLPTRDDRKVRQDIFSTLVTDEYVCHESKKICPLTYDQDVSLFHQRFSDEWVGKKRF